MAPKIREVMREFLGCAIKAPTVPYRRTHPGPLLSPKHFGDGNQFLEFGPLLLKIWSSEFEINLPSEKDYRENKLTIQYARSPRGSLSNLWVKMRKIAIVSVVLKLDFWPSSRLNCVVLLYTVGSLGPSAWGAVCGPRRCPPLPPDSDTRRVLIKLSSSSIKLRCSQDFVERIGIASAAFFLFDVHNCSRADHWTDWRLMRHQLKCSTDDDVSSRPFFDVHLICQPLPSAWKWIENVNELVQRVNGVSRNLARRHQRHWPISSFLSPALPYFLLYASPILP